MGKPFIELYHHVWKAYPGRPGVATGFPLLAPFFTLQRIHPAFSCLYNVHFVDREVWKGVKGVYTAMVKDPLRKWDRVDTVSALLVDLGNYVYIVMKWLTRNAVSKQLLFSVTIPDYNVIKVPKMHLPNLIAWEQLAFLFANCPKHPHSPGIMQIYLKQIALFGLIAQCIWSKCPKTHIKNLVEYSTRFFICSSWDLREMYYAIKLNKAISLGSNASRPYFRARIRSPCL